MSKVILLAIMASLLAGCGEKVYSVEELKADEALTVRIELECRSLAKRPTAYKDQQCLNSREVIDEWSLEKRAKMIRH